MPIDRFVTRAGADGGQRRVRRPGGLRHRHRRTTCRWPPRRQVLAQGVPGRRDEVRPLPRRPGHGGHKQEELFAVAAMLDRKPVKVPATSTVQVAEGARKPAVRVALKPGQAIDPDWELPPDRAGRTAARRLAPQGRRQPRTARRRLITSPRNERFAQVIVNRLWKRWLGGAGRAGGRLGRGDAAPPRAVAAPWPASWRARLRPEARRPADPQLPRLPADGRERGGV